MRPASLQAYRYYPYAQSVMQTCKQQAKRRYIRPRRVDGTPVKLWWTLDAHRVCKLYFAHPLVYASFSVLCFLRCPIGGKPRFWWIWSGEIRVPGVYDVRPKPFKTGVPFWGQIS